MKITITAGIEYRICISPEPLEHDGDLVAGLWVWAERTIWIDCQLPVERRREVLVHELHHAWEYHIGVPKCSEAAANNAVAFDQVCRRIHQLDLEKLVPDSIPDRAGSDDVPAQAVGAECFRCGQRFNAQQIGDEPARCHSKSGRQTIDRGVYCDHCGHVQVWVEEATGAGNPTGVVVGKPRTLFGQKKVEWFGRHADTSGVIVA